MAAVASRHGAGTRPALAFGLLSMVLLLVAADTAQAAFPASNGKVAFRGEGGIFTVDPAVDPPASTITPVRATPAKAPAWSADGSKLAFFGAHTLWTMNPDGTGQTLVANLPCNGLQGLTWSPDGTRLGLACEGKIYTIKADGSDMTQLTSAPPFETTPNWSPNGAEIAYSQAGKIMVADANGGGVPRGLTRSSHFESNPNWSPDGQRVAFDRNSSDPDAARALWVINADGSGETRITPPSVGWSASDPAWSPDGTYIVYTLRETSTAPDEIHLLYPQSGADWFLAAVDFGVEADWQPVGPAQNPYVRPGGASPLRTSLVPAYQACEAAAANRTHGAPLDHPSCAPPTRRSETLTVGTPDANGAPVRASGWVRLVAMPGAPGGLDDADVAVMGVITDVRNGGDLSGYTGELEVRLTVRITDRRNEPGTGATAAATVEEIPLSVVTTCAPTTSGGGICPIDTTLDSIVANAVPEGSRSIWELGEVQVFDGGPDGAVDSQPNGLFMTQGIFVP